MPANPFVDVADGEYFHTPVLWAVEKGITNGVSPNSFGPASDCTRAHVVTFLWRAAGSPEPASSENPFVDVDVSTWYGKAVLWAVEKGITNGMGPNTFAPNDVCTRGQVVTFLHRYAGTPAPASQSHSFNDIEKGQFYYNAVLWAVEKGITNGMGEGIFAPAGQCNRGQIVTFLYRFINGQ